ncbi:hypothetical protein FN846DRAFT_753531, partial [Sphaerosporella brunnea]
TSTARPSATERASSDAAGNQQLALEQNQAFAKLTPESSCDASDPNQANACINGSFSQCVNGKYLSIVQCSKPLKCFALPLQTGQGVSVACTTMEDAALRM